MSFEDFTQMHVWQLAFKLLKNIYEITRNFPSEEKFGLVSDMRRAANSVTHNIAEGFGRFSPLDKTRFYKISRGSCFELISQTLVSFELNFMKTKLEKDKIVNQCKDIINELNSLIKTIEIKAKPKP